MARSLAHTKWMCKFHIIFAPKYRRKIIYNKYNSEYSRNIERFMQVERGRDHRREGNGGSHTPAGIHSAEDECIEFHGIPEREECDDDFRSACELEIQVWEQALLVAGVFVSTVGLNEATIAKYVREQEKHDQMMDRISTTEAEDPFRGS